MHRQIQNVALSVFESDPVLSRRLSSLSLWTSLQALGRDTISERLIIAFESCRIMFEIVSKCKGVRVLVMKLHSNETLNFQFISLCFSVNFQSKSPGGEIKATITDLVNKPLNFPVSKPMSSNILFA